MDYRLKELNQPIDLYKNVKVPDDCGGYENRWIFYQKRWAHVTLKDPHHVTVIIRHKKISDGLLVVWENKSFKITHHTHDEGWYTILYGENNHATLENL